MGAGPSRHSELQRVRVGLLGAYHSRNLGDTAIQAAVMANLRNHWRDAEFLGISWDPQDARRCHGIDSVSLLDATDGAPIEEPERATGSRLGDRMRRVAERLAVKQVLARPGQLRRISAVVGSLDLLVISGGGQLDDFWGGPWSHPHALFTWVALARLHRVPIAVFGVGIDDISTRLGRLFAFVAMRLAQERYVRDGVTLDILRRAGVRGPLRVGPDPAFSLQLPDPHPHEPASDQCSVLVCPIAHRAWLTAPTHEYAAYLDALGTACVRLAEDGVQVRLAYSQTANDRRVVDSMGETLRARLGSHAQVNVEHTDTVAAFLRAAQQADVVVGSRLHALILAALAARPLVAVSYARKVEQLMTDLELGDYVLDVNSVQPEALTQLVRRAIAERDVLSLRLHSILARYQKELAAEYLNVVALVAERRVSQRSRT